MNEVYVLISFLKGFESKTIHCVCMKNLANKYYVIPIITRLKLPCLLDIRVTWKVPS